MIYKQQRNYENLQRMMFDGAGPYGIPMLEPANWQADNWIGFNYARTCEEPEIHGVHFFVDDYQFIRLWTDPERYVHMLRKFQAVCTPDFSMFTDWPLAVQIYNHYRKHWLGAFWQFNGVHVIPTVCWSDEASYEWCFDGEPVGGTVAVSAVGTQQGRESRRLFLAGYREMLDRLQPETIIFYGPVPDGCEGNIVPIRAFQDKWRKED